MIKYKHRPKGITKADAEAEKAENLIQQDFSAEKPNEKWLMDITEIQCKDTKLYLAPVLDCYDGTIRGFKMDTNMRAELCVEAFERACRSDDTSDMILHSDRGRQFTSYVFRKALKKHGAIQSMSGVGRCYDNARMESFFATLKKEKLYKMDTTRMMAEEVKTVIFRYIYYYNLRRIYSRNNGWPPAVYRQMYFESLIAA
jgi:putative transposase